MVSGLWVAANVSLARRELAAGRPAEAIVRLEAATVYPANLGEGKHLLTQENEIQVLLGLAHRAAGALDEARRWLDRAAAPQGDPAAPIGESAYWRALALQELGEDAAATGLLGVLLQAARARARTSIRIDYFATSLPALLLFDEDLDRRNRIECRYLEGLALAGLGRAGAGRAFRDVLALERTHAGARSRRAELGR